MDRSSIYYNRHIFYHKVVKMKISREFAINIVNFFDNYIPPVLRDSKLFMSCVMYPLFGKRKDIFMDFKDHVFHMNEDAFIQTYIDVSDLSKLQGETDLNQKCTEEILKMVEGTKVLEVGCGRGYLSNLLSLEGHQVTGVDIHIENDLVNKFNNIQFIEGNIQKLPFENHSFDTVICTHTLEHVQDIYGALIELRRVTKNRLIICIPKQRPYKYTFNLHIHFFPYKWTIEAVFGTKNITTIVDLNDWLIVEDYHR